MNLKHLLATILVVSLYLQCTEAWRWKTKVEDTVRKVEEEGDKISKKVEKKVSEGTKLKKEVLKELMLASMKVLMKMQAFAPTRQKMQASGEEEAIPWTGTMENH